MREKAILAGLHDYTGAIQMLDLLNIELGQGIPVTGGVPKLLFCADGGYWILEEFAGTGTSAKHVLEFASLGHVQELELELTDKARHSSDANARLRGSHLRVTFTSVLTGSESVLEIDGGVASEAVHDDDDAVRLWGIVQQMLAAGTRAGVSVLVTAESAQ